MDFSQALARFVGRSVEVFLTTQFFAGTLLAVQPGSYSVQVTPSAYTPGNTVLVAEANTVFVRIFPV